MTDVFSHNLSDAWGISKVSVRVRGTEKHNAICSESGTKIKYTIPSNAVDEIREIIKNSNLLELNDLDFPPVLDGTTDRFVFFSTAVKQTICFRQIYGISKTMFPKKRKTSCLPYLCEFRKSCSQTAMTSGF